VTTGAATGLVIEPGSAAALTAALRWCLANRAELAAMGERGRRLAEKEYDRARTTARFGQVVEEAAAGHPGRA
jgi:glycosyltransferase involved in cell wall biosynthesis